MFVEIVQVICVIVLSFKSAYHVLHVRYVLEIKMLQVVPVCLHMGVVTPANPISTCAGPTLLYNVPPQTNL